ncbi:MAG TPA: acyl carrier protein [Candidatus Methylomirabilis sp.]|nr:acyl carrier protein [Candidatus Methylomirabilis sp.]
MPDPTLETVQAIVTRYADPVPVGAGPDMSLTDGGFALDSISLLRAIIECEERFQVVFDPDTDFTDQNLSTVRTLFHLICAKRPG